MEQLTREKVKNLLGDMVCNKDLRCVEQGYDELCRAKDIGDKSFLVCLDEDSECSFTSFPGESDHWWCKCPVRMFIKREYDR